MANYLNQQKRKQNESEETMPRYRYTVQAADQVAETRLWRAVLGQALEDAFSPDTYLKTSEDRKEALAYLQSKDNKYLKWICENAGFDVSFVQRKVRKKLAADFVDRIKRLSVRVR
jgi:hypothetical protein